MRHWQQGVSYCRNRKARREAMLRRLAAMRAAKARKRLERVADGWEPEPKMLPFYPLEILVRDKLSGEMAAFEFKSVRDAMRRLAVVKREYVPGVGRAFPLGQPDTKWNWNGAPSGRALP